MLLLNTGTHALAQRTYGFVTESGCIGDFTILSFLLLQLC